MKIEWGKIMYCVTVFACGFVMVFGTFGCAGFQAIEWEWDKDFEYKNWYGVTKTGKWIPLHKYTGKGKGKFSKDEKGWKIEGDATVKSPEFEKLEFKQED